MAEADNRPATAVRERLQLGIHTYRRERGLAVLAVRVHGPGEGAAGDDRKAAMAVMSAIAGCLSPTDTLARIEPGRYLALLERAKRDPFAMHTADAIIAAVEKAHEGAPPRPTASVGISVYPDDGETVDELVEGALGAAEAAALSGGGFFGFSSKSMGDAAQRRTQVERCLSGALERNEFTLHYQPQLDSRDGTLLGAEALLRYQNATMGRISPGEFIPVLEQTGAIREVGAWALRAACEQAAAWASEGRPIRISVNVSAEQLTGDLDSVVASALKHAELDPTLLELELTESVLVEDPVKVRATLEAIRKRGVRIAVDDFGTGYASLAYVRAFPMDTLKIDRQFVRGLPLDNEAAAITSAICALARSLRLELVAEGVENAAEEEFLHSLGCFAVQGFLHARPMPAAELSAWRNARPWA